SPDYQIHLQAEGNPIGKTEEWIRLTRPEKLQPAARQLRTEAASDVLAARLPEDVLHYKKEQRLLPLEKRRLGQRFAIQDNIRLNVERYLKYMDDPVKELAVLDSDGNIRRTASRK